MQSPAREVVRGTREALAAGALYSDLGSIVFCRVWGNVSELLVRYGNDDMELHCWCHMAASINNKGWNYYQGVQYMYTKGLMLVALIRRIGIVHAF